MGIEGIDTEEPELEIKKELHRFRSAGVYLDTRYKECGKESGHLKSDNARNLCEHCFRRLSYKTELVGGKVSDGRVFEENVDRCRGLIEMVRQYDL